MVAFRDELRSIGVEPEESPPSSEVLIEQFLAAGEVIRGSLAWEFLAVLVCRSKTPWSVLDRRCLRPPLEFRVGEPGETIPHLGGIFDCYGLPVLADDEAARFCDIGTAGALFPKQVAQTDRNVIEFIVGNGFPAVGQGADIQVILKVFTDARQVEPDFDTMRFQVIGGPDAGKHQ